MVPQYKLIHVLHSKTLTLGPQFHFKLYHFNHLFIMEHFPLVKKPLCSPWQPPELWSSCTGRCWCHWGWTEGLRQSCSEGPGQSCWHSTCWSPTSWALCREPPPARSHDSIGRSNGQGIHNNATSLYNLKCGQTAEPQDIRMNLSKSKNLKYCGILFPQIQGNTIGKQLEIENKNWNFKCK